MDADPVEQVAPRADGRQTTSTGARIRIWSQIDRRVISDAAIRAGVYARALLYRNPHLTSVYVHKYYGMYDYASLGLK